MLSVALRVRHFLGVIEDRLGFAIAETLGAVDHGVGELGADRPGV